MAKDAAGAKVSRPRNQDGRLRDTRDNKYVGTLLKRVGIDSVNV